MFYNNYRLHSTLGYLSPSQYEKQLVEIKKTHGTLIHIDLEPEPDGMLENTQEVIDYYNDFLLKFGLKELQKKIKRISEVEFKPKYSPRAHLNIFTAKELTELANAIGQIESGYKTKVQIGGGPARSYWQVEPTTALSLLNNLLKYDAIKTDKKKCQMKYSFTLNQR